MKRTLMTVLTVLAGVLVVAGSVLFFGMGAQQPTALAATVVGTKSTDSGEVPHATLELSIYPNQSDAVPPPAVDDPTAQVASASQQWPFYTPSTNIEVPAHSLVTVTIHQYDTGGQIYNPFLATVQGTVDGTADYDGESKDKTDPNTVAHTFTIHQYPESTQPDLFVNVPVPANSANAPADANGYPKHPKEITFSFMTGDAGEYIWNCEFPCGSGYVEFGGPMQQRGWMSGTLTVV
ncbi:MAG: hypothetical protein U0R64_06370 [Candidatus Nanopelagicales bacterium]